MPDLPDILPTSVAEPADTALVGACHAERARQAERLDGLAKELFGRRDTLRYPAQAPTYAC
jgi:hypothetical protein